MKRTCFYNARLVDTSTDSPGLLLVEGEKAIHSNQIPGFQRFVQCLRAESKSLNWQLPPPAKLCDNIH